MKTVLSREIVEAAINQLLSEKKIPSIRNIRAITGGSYKLLLRYRKEIIGGIPNDTAILNLLVSKIDNLDRTIQNLSSQIQDLSKVASKKKKS